MALLYWWLWRQATSPPLPYRAQVSQVTDTINNALQAQATQVVGVLAIGLCVSVLVILIAMLSESRTRAERDKQQFDLLKAEIANNAQQNIELQRQSKTLDDMEFHLSKISGDMSQNLEVNRERATVHDANRDNINKILAVQATDKAEILLRFNELRTDVNTALAKNPALTSDEVKRFEAKLDLIILRLQLKADIPALPATIEPPPTPVDPEKQP